MSKKSNRTVASVRDGVNQGGEKADQAMVIALPMMPE
jgi:hypothetical protein